MSRRKARMLGIAAIGVILMLLAVVLFERARGASQLREVLERLRAAQVEIDPTKVVTHSVPDAENAAVALWEITDELRAFSLPEDLAPIPVMKYGSPGEAQSFVRSDGWLGRRGVNTRWQQLDKTRADASLLFEKLVEISKRPRFVTPLDISKGVADMEFRSLSALPSVMRVVRLVAMCDLHLRQDHRAVEAVLTLLDVFATKSEDNWGIAELVKWAHARLGMALTWELLQNAKVSDEQWVKLQIAWERCEFSAPYERVTRMELAGVSDYFIRLKGSSVYRMQMIDKFEQIERDFGGSWEPLLSGKLLRWAHLPLWRLLWADQDYAYSMRYREMEFLLASFARTNNWKDVKAETARRVRRTEAYGEEKSVYDRIRYLFSFSPESFAGVELVRAYQAETEARLVVTAIALQRYSMAEGRYPEKLEELVPRFLAQVPTDPMDGEALKYRRLEDGNYLLYSSGVDGEDDGGSAELEDESSAPNLWNGADAVWPRRVEPAT